MGKEGNPIASRTYKLRWRIMYSAEAWSDAGCPRSAQFFQIDAVESPIDPLLKP